MSVTPSAAVGLDRKRRLKTGQVNDEPLAMMFRSVSMLALCALAGASCRPPSATAADSSATRYPHPESFVVSIDTSEWPHPAGWRAPLYPRGPRMRGENARVIVTTIIDSTGAPERRSVTLLSAPNREFDHAVCDYFAEVHFTWPPGRARRALVIIPFDFEVAGAAPLPPAPDYRDLAGQFNAIPRLELVARLETERHCF